MKNFLFGSPLKRNAKAFEKRLSAYTLDERAYIRALAAFRQCFFSEMFGLANDQIFRNPTGFPKSQVQALYDHMILMHDQLTQTHQKVTEFIQQSQQASLQGPYRIHALFLKESLDLWLVTLSAGLEPKLLQYVERCWDILEVSRDALFEAIERVKSIEHTLSMMTTQRPSLCESLPDKQWLEQCAFKPTFTNSTLST